MRWKGSSAEAETFRVEGSKFQREESMGRSEFSGSPGSCEAGAFGVKDKPGYAYFVADDGSIREIQKGAPEGTPPKVVAPKGTG